MNGSTNRKLHHWANGLFHLLPLLAALYIAMVLVPAASDRWPARFMSWQELSLVTLVIFLSLASVRPLYRLRHGMMRQYAALNGVAAVISLFAMLGGAAALLLHSSRWVVGAYLVGAALPPVVRGLAGAGHTEPDRRFKI